MTTPSQIDVSTLREGDVVTVRGKIIEMGKAGPLVSIDTLNPDPSGAFHHSRLDIVSVEPHPLKVGDRVLRGTSEVNIRAIAGEWAWTTWPNSESGAVSRLSDLVRA
ncbi:MULTISPECIES: hypothetical protein [unclassified Aureimonas]|uniref:hypothetical protein n=1 Tax=unclassified Aureimonas TaxID=2615206 RepID=UPI0006F7ECA3|nr:MULTISPECIES: hypothetical protein [unclassified Aureimonas]KQT52175.1 hypothetical protein ASG62_16080 [Aureimonas sp. Leaf427]KQT70592.1 hypothetical protein ASG54_21870 [Aureimonas sp. Leaf460]